MRKVVLCVLLGSGVCAAEDSSQYETDMQAYDLRSCRQLVFSNYDDLEPSLPYMGNPLIKKVASDLEASKESLIIGYDPDRYADTFSVICSAELPGSSKNAAYARLITCYLDKDGAIVKSTFVPFFDGGLKAFQCATNCAPANFLRIYEGLEDEGQEYGPNNLQDRRKFAECRANSSRK